MKLLFPATSIELIIKLFSVFLCSMYIVALLYNITSKSTADFLIFSFLLCFCVAGYLFSRRLKVNFKIKDNSLLLRYRNIIKQINISEIARFQLRRVLYPFPGHAEMHFGAMTIDEKYIELYEEKYTIFFYRWVKFVEQLSHSLNIEVETVNLVEDTNGKLYPK
ncbi:MAG: hypothetical protein WBG37_03380 [Desulfobacterales bacterium]